MTELAESPVETALDLFLDQVLRGEPSDSQAFLARHDEVPEAASGRFHLLAEVLGGRTAPSELTLVHHPDELPRERIDDFRLIRMLGQGGMGVVYLAEQVSLGRLVALKLVRPEHIASPKAIERFQRESRTVARLRHPNIVNVYAAGEDAGICYLAMELVRGKGLDEVLAERHADQGRLSVDQALRWCRDIAEALHYAHREGVIHRDVKPSNIRITPAGKALLMDFGLARDAESFALTVTGEFQGSPYYASPEQIRSRTHELDGRTDVYSLGVTLYQALTGHPPFQGETPEQVFHQILTSAPNSLRRQQPGLARDVEIVTQKALEKEPERRYATAADLAEDLEAILELRPIHATPPKPWVRVWKWARRNPAAAVATTLAVLLFVGGPLTYVFVQAAENAEQRRIADTRMIPYFLERSEELWPPHPRQLPALTELVQSLHALQARRTIHEDHLASLEQRGNWDAELEQWRFGDPTTEHEYASMQRFLTRFDELGGLIESLEHRRQFALTVVERSLDSPAARKAWQQAQAAIRVHPEYGGLELVPQFGLLPLRPDPVTDYWEFWHLQSGERPQFDPQSGRWRIVPETGIVLVLLPAGRFHMGSSSTDAEEPGVQPDPAHEEREAPAHPVDLEAFFLAKYEVTQGQWQRIAGENPSRYSRQGNPDDVDDRHPVENVSWLDAARVLSRMDLEFPTEAQWEYACRAKTDQVWSCGSRAVDLQGHANIADQHLYDRTGFTNWVYTLDVDDGFAVHAPVGSFTANAFGLYDMHGNILEWCRDWYEEPYSATQARDGDGLREGGRQINRVQRGGAWSLSAGDARSAARIFNLPSYRDQDVGVRAARAIRSQPD